jgi:hypothetical protein
VEYLGSLKEATSVPFSNRTPLAVFGIPKTAEDTLAARELVAGAVSLHDKDDGKFIFFVSTHAELFG